MRVALLMGCVQNVLDPEINAATIRLLTRLGCEVVVASGSGQHLYWFLETPYRAAAHDGWQALEAVTRRLARALQADAGWAANKLLRVPGTRNHKYQPPRRVAAHRGYDVP